MDNIQVEKIWEDESLIELKITVSTKYAIVYQTYYTNSEELLNISQMIINYADNFTKGYYIKMGNKEGNYTPALSMNFLKADASGHTKIEMDIEIADVDDRSHRCMCFVNSELGAIEKFGMNLRKICDGDLGETITLLDNG